MQKVAIACTSIARYTRSEIWYDLACAATALDVWGPACLAHDEGRTPRLIGRVSVEGR